MAAVEDNIREVEWRDLADTVLIFVCQDSLYGTNLLVCFQDGLFAAFLSAFLVFLIPQLQPSSTDVAMDVLIHISHQLSNSTIPAFEPTAFQVSSNAAAVNILLFLSLALVLFDAFLAMLVKGWLQEFDRGWRTFTVAHLRAQERERRVRELERWKLEELVALLPILIQGSLLLFCVGLIVLIFPLHLPSAMLCTIAFIFGVGFYAFTTYVSIVNDYAPFSSPVSRLLARGLAILPTWLLPNTLNTAPATPLPNRPLPLPHDSQSGAGTPQENTEPLHLNNGVAKPAQPHKLDGVEKAKVVPHSRPEFDPQTHVHVLERLVTTTAQAVENIPIFLELLDQPVRDATLRPFDVEKWRELLHITLGLLRDQSSFSVSAACTLARSLTICYNSETADQQLCHTLQVRLGSTATINPVSRVPLNLLFSCYLRSWLSHFVGDGMWRTIASLEPSDAADAELLWMVNTFHSTIHSEDVLRDRFGFYVAVLAYVSSTEQSRRSHVPLTAAVLYALYIIRAESDQRSGGAIDRRYVLPGIVSTSESVPLTFCQVDGTDALNRWMWSKDCIQFVKDLLQSYQDDEFQLSLIAALYIDSTKHADARSTFGELLELTHITNIRSRFSDAYDQGKLAVYWYMALSQKTLDHPGLPPANVYNVIENTIATHSTLRVSGLRIMEIAVKYVHKATPLSSDWLEKRGHMVRVLGRGKQHGHFYTRVDYWVLLHLDTILATQCYLLPEEVKWLKWSDKPEQVYIAKARLDFYGPSAETEHTGVNGPRPDPDLLRVFLWSNDYGVCTRTFTRCLALASISQPATHGDAHSTPMFIPETMGYEWVEHFVHVLCEGDHFQRVTSWIFLKSQLVPKWTTLPSSWCCHFASALMFFIVQLPDTHGLPAYQCFAQASAQTSAKNRQFDHPWGLRGFLSFLATLLEHTKFSLTWTSLTSLETWWSQTPDEHKNQESRTQMEQILVATKQHLVEVTLGCFQELPMAG